MRKTLATLLFLTLFVNVCLPDPNTALSPVKDELAVPPRHGISHKVTETHMAANYKEQKSPYMISGTVIAETGVTLTVYSGNEQIDRPALGNGKAELKVQWMLSENDGTYRTPDWSHDSYVAWKLNRCPGKSNYKLKCTPVTEHLPPPGEYQAPLIIRAEPSDRTLSPLRRQSSSNWLSKRKERR